MSTNLNVIPDDVTSYKTKEYWEKRYSEESPATTFDWFKTFQDLKLLFDKHLPNKEIKILMLGCGNSTLSEDMYDEGYHNIVNVDFSETVIENMKNRCVDRTGMTWLVMDIRDLKFLDEEFDVVIDKGTMDALMCDDGDVWNPKPEVVENVKREVDQVGVESRRKAFGKAVLERKHRNVRFHVHPLYISPTCKIPGPPVDHLFLGNVKNLIKAEPGGMQYEWAQKYGGFVCYHSLFNRPMLSITDPDLLHKIIVSNAYDFSKPPQMINDLKAALGCGLIIAEGVMHQKQRRMMMPAFSFSNVKEMIPTFVHVAHQLKSIWVTKIADGEERIVISPYFLKATLDVIGLVGFDYSFNNLTSSNELATAYDEIFNYEPTPLNTALKILATFIPFVRKIPFSINLRLDRAIKVVEKRSMQVIQEKKNLASKGKLQGRDLMSLLININENEKEDAEKMTDLELQYQVGVEDIIFLVFTLFPAFTSSMIFTDNDNPRCQEKLRQELIAAFPDPKFKPTFDDLNGLEYLNCVFKEVLRLAPSIPLVIRSPREDTVLNEYTIPKNTPIVIPIFAIHRLPSVWGEDAEEFKPERWQSIKTLDGNNFSYLPFFSGPRSCIGNKIALNEFKVFLSVLVRNFRFREVEDFKIKKIQGMALKAFPNIELWVSKVSEQEDEK
ncbi:10345_t:CDS:10 [Acaulospora morrowiae]|uniref:10345_t:CDS:1 n=1 Tax=Acaulospora morrowiae TaxID=94023 RepID=A0A9N8YR45_9GLOM|nr:10345_t:CDS:10 [Acaulospora morrowiae]